MAVTRDLPEDFAAALDRVPEARDRFHAMPADRQAQWIDWIERAGGRQRAERIDEAIDRLLPASVATRDEVTEPIAPPPERNWWIWLLLLLLLVVAGLLLWYFLARGGGKRTVPDVIGLTSSAAAQRLHDKDLDVVPNTGPSTRPVGIVFAQRPGAGAQVDKGANVTILISGGLTRKPVPNVTDLPVTQAEQQLTTAGFKTAVKRVSSTRASGLVTAQEPAPGVTAVKGATVTLSVSSGQKPVAVPSFVGSQQGAAVTKLTKLGLKPQLQNVASSQPAGQVVSQKPPAGQQVDKGSTVVLNVSSGSPGGTTTTQTTTTQTTTTTATTSAGGGTGTAAAGGASVPAVRGLAANAGLRRLNTAGLRPIVRYVPSSSRAGIIVAQSPTGTATRGSRVRISVSEGPSPATPTSVPGVVGQDQASAAQALNQAGFKPLVLFRKTNDSSKSGVVVEEQPTAGASIPAGSYVAIFVGRA
jgi:beta-lactam-binding protein with PASTA domain